MDSVAVGFELDRRTPDARDVCLEGRFAVAHCIVQVEPVGDPGHQRAVHSWRVERTREPL